MRAYELTKNRQKRKKHLRQEADQNAALWRLMYGDFEYINRNQSHLLAEIEAKTEELERLKDEFMLEIEKAELDFETKQHIKDMAQKRIKKIMRN
ncbi:hypothetical protein MTBPR1_60031 [Candidatus Terasakiella magnetica]|uniref:Uncharacterized protein n=1 Tax=Candidatus Terasakiella magnetica TaxID=1867952 RepID=A0A1C3RJS2_9PROT|nr:hypothetical protein [Candidatus Terasakiella magnetica]SCA57518.1 hypothetical protein MTBPR1_60031 [Candidatus Terasakiella magnetica]